MTDTELLNRLLAMFDKEGDQLFYMHMEDVSVGEVDPELEPHLIARLSADG
jgi:hypothetical protein